MERNEILNWVIDKIESHGFIPENVCIESLNYVESGYIDSMAFLKFMIEVEMEFNININDEEMLNPDLFKIGGLTDFIINKINKK